jgi:hypothetical protein
MPARDLFHDHVKNALIKDGWEITDDPLKLNWKRKPIYIDLGAQRKGLLGARKGSRRIAVEIKSFISASSLEDLYDALGQFFLYDTALSRSEPERELYLAIREPVYLSLFTGAEGEELRLRARVKLIVFDDKKQEILQWIE